MIFIKNLFIFLLFRVALSLTCTERFRSILIEKETFKMNTTHFIVDLWYMDKLKDVCYPNLYYKLSVNLYWRQYFGPYKGD